MLDRVRFRSYEKDYDVFTDLLEVNPEARLLDIGCKEGGRTLQFAAKIGTSHIVGVDIQNLHVPFILVQTDIDAGLPTLERESFDVVTVSQVLEHVSNTDRLIKEAYRILKPNGYVVVGTPNIASGRVILELLLNKQPNTSHVSDYFILRGDPGQEWRKSEGNLHRRLFTLEGLRSLLEYYDFKVEKEVGTGYGPFPFLEAILRGRYAANLVVKARK